MLDTVCKTRHQFIATAGALSTCHHQLKAARHCNQNSSYCSANLLSCNLMLHSFAQTISLSRFLSCNLMLHNLEQIHHKALYSYHGGIKHRESMHDVISVKHLRSIKSCYLEPKVLFFNMEYFKL
jgi:hypothetical protein